MSELRSQRVCLIENDVNIVVDYFPEVEGAPLVAVCYLDSNCSEKDAEKRPVKLPDYLPIARDITGMPDFQSKALATRVVAAQ